MAALKGYLIGDFSINLFLAEPIRNVFKKLYTILLFVGRSLATKSAKSNRIIIIVPFKA